MISKGRLEVPRRRGSRWFLIETGTPMKPPLCVFSARNRAFPTDDPAGGPR